MNTEDVFRNLADELGTATARGGELAPDALARAEAALRRAAKITERVRSAFRDPSAGPRSHMDAMLLHSTENGLRSWCWAEFRYPDEVFTYVWNQYLELDAARRNDFHARFGKQSGWRYFMEELGHPRLAPRTGQREHPTLQSTS